MHIRSVAKFLAILVFVAVLAPASTQAKASTPVERLNATLLHVMQNADQLGYRTIIGIALEFLDDSASGLNQQSGSVWQ